VIGLPEAAPQRAGVGGFGQTRRVSDQAPFADIEAEEGQGAAEQVRVGIRLRLADLFGRGDPVLGVLVTATLIATLGRGLTMTLTVLYLAIVAGLTPGEIAVASTAAAIAGIGSSYVGGWLSDRISARRLLVVLTVVDAFAVAAYVVVDDLVLAIIVGVVSFGVASGARSAQSAIIARAFEGPLRIRARAVLRTVTNIGIAVGSGAAAAVLLVDTAVAYRLTFVVAAVLALVGAFVVVRLPARVDAGGGGAAEGESPAPVRGRSPWRDPRYLAFTGLAAIFGIQFSVLEYGIPLWIERETAAPRVMVSVLLILNTVIVTAFTVVLSRGTENPRKAGRVFAIAGVLMGVACAVYGLAAGAPIWVAILALVAGGIAHAFSEVLSQGAGWGLAFELADPASAGAYQGLVGMGYGVLGAVGPPLLAITVLSLGMVGWLILGVMFVAASLGILVIGRRAARTWSPG
jgi:MFS family permease